MVIQSPPGWGWDQIRLAVHEIGAAKPEEYWHKGTAADAPPAVRRIDLGDLWNALARGVADFEANRTDVIFLCVIYPVIGLVLGAGSHPATDCCRCCSRSPRASRWSDRSPPSG